MIGFFRRIRKKLADDNQFLKYSRYAIGEIVLVVIGILIALQINNWNEARKLSSIERQLLKDIVIGLKNDRGVINFNIAKHSQAFESCQVILNTFEMNEKYYDSLSYHFATSNNYTVFKYNHGPYESLKSMGFEVMSNKQIGYAIFNLYDSWYQVLISNQNRLSEDIDFIRRNFYQKHFDKFKLFSVGEKGTGSFGMKYSGEMIPIDFEELKKDNQYIYYLQSIKDSHENFIIMSKHILAAIERNILSINKEVDNLGNTD